MSYQAIQEKIENFNEDIFFNKINKKNNIKQNKPIKFQPYNDAILKKNKIFSKNKSIGIGGFLGLASNKNKFLISFMYPIQTTINLSNTILGIRLGNISLSRIDSQGIYFDSMICIQGIVQISGINLNIGGCLIFKNIINTTKLKNNNKNQNNFSNIFSTKQQQINKFTTNFTTLLKPFISLNVNANINKKIKINIEFGYIKDYGYNFTLSLKQ